MANKKTRKEFFGELRKLAEKAGNLEAVAFCDHEVDLINKKRANSTQTATQKANEEIKDRIVEILTELGKAVTISELQAESEEMAQYSNQKLSALLKQLVDTKVVTKSIDKKKSYFSM